MFKQSPYFALADQSLIPLQAPPAPLWIRYCSITTINSYSHVSYLRGAMFRLCAADLSRRPTTVRTAAYLLCLSLSLSLSLWESKRLRSCCRITLRLRQQFYSTTSSDSLLMAPLTMVETLAETNRKICRPKNTDPAWFMALDLTLQQMEALTVL